MPTSASGGVWAAAAAGISESHTAASTIQEIGIQEAPAGLKTAGDIPDGL